MTREETIRWLEGIKHRYIHGGDEGFDEKRKDALDTAIRNLAEIKALGEDLRMAQGCMKAEALVGFNMAVAIMNKHLGEVEDDKGRSD